jgi:hypothetical protein
MTDLAHAYLREGVGSTAGGDLGGVVLLNQALRYFLTDRLAR